MMEKKFTGLAKAKVKAKAKAKARVAVASLKIPTALLKTDLPLA